MLIFKLSRKEKDCHHISCRSAGTQVQAVSWDLGNVILLFHSTYPPETEQLRVHFPFTPLSLPLTEQLPCTAACVSVKVRLDTTVLELSHRAELVGWEQGEGFQKAARTEMGCCFCPHYSGGKPRAAAQMGAGDQN